MSNPRPYLTADGTSYAVAHDDGTVAAEGRVGHRGDHFLASVDEPRGPASAAELGAVLDRLARLAATLGDEPLWWVVSAPGSRHDAAADAAGLHPWRDLLQMRRPLPVEDAVRADLPPVATRPFRPDLDDRAWVEVNNRSFAGHPDQSDRTVDDLRRLRDEPWFDADGFRLLDADPAGPRAGHLDGFCWTKVHPGEEPLGEIYVIGVDPTASGRGLGPALTLAGLDHLHDRGVRTAMLYVDQANTRAIATYRRLGFTTHHVDRIYRSR